MYSDRNALEAMLYEEDLKDIQIYLNFHFETFMEGCVNREVVNTMNYKEYNVLYSEKNAIHNISKHLYELHHNC